MRILEVEAHNLDAAWPHARVWLEKAAVRGRADYPLDDVRTDVEQGKKRLFKLLGADGFVWVLLGLTQNSQARRCVVYMLGGKGLKNMLADVVEFCEAWAMWNRANSISCSGRAAWVRELAPFGWAETGRICGKELDYGKG